MSLETDLRATPPAELGAARALAHQASQLLTRAARANLSARADDSHSNLGWNEAQKMFWSRPMAGSEGPCFVALSISPLKLGIVSGGGMRQQLDLDNCLVADAANWLDNQLRQLDLKPASGVSLPYELPPEVAQISTYRIGDQAAALTTLSAWFAVAHSVLSAFAARNAGIKPGPGDVRCWPHHFDIATYVGLEEGDFETAKGIGVGLSPGDETYGEPYFYVNPWPHMNTGDLPDPPKPGHWHTEGFVGAIATADEMLSLPEIEPGLTAFVDAAFSIGREKLGR